MPAQQMPALPFSTMTTAHGLFFFSGQVAQNRENGMIESSDVATQTAVIMQNLADDMAKHGLDFKKVCQIRLFMTDPNGVEAALSALKPFLATPQPALSCFVVRALPNPAAIVEIELMGACAS